MMTMVKNVSFSLEDETADKLESLISNSTAKTKSQFFGDLIDELYEKQEAGDEK